MLRSIFLVFAAAALGCGGQESGGTRASPVAGAGVGSGTAMNSNPGAISCPGNCALLGAVCDSTTGLCERGPGAAAPGGTNAKLGDAGPIDMGNCFPAPGSCDGPPPQLSPLDTVHGCLGAPVALPDVCSTSVNRCNGNSGLALDCAFAPDGGVFVGLTTDNYVLTGNGWIFAQPPSLFPGPSSSPADEVASAAQYDECARLAVCAPPCPGIDALPSFASCEGDAGQSDSASNVAGAASTEPVDEPASCQPGGPGMTNCGPGGIGVQSCCASPELPSGSFYRDYDGVTYLQMNGQTTLSTLRIDKYEITVGRFRQFVGAAASGWLPAPGSGKHAHLNGGRGLVNGADLSGATYETGWDSSWDPNLAATVGDWTSNLSCNEFATWTPSPGAGENRPINCVNWYEVYAFCIWDGGFLPSDAEWNYAASGGSEQRVFPWSIPPTLVNIDCSYANYGGDGSNPPGFFCSPDRTNDVGSESPKGDGKWAHADLGGNVWEWVLDYATGGSCVDCAYTSPPPYEPPPASPNSGAARMKRGGGLGAGFSLEASTINDNPATTRTIEQGGRCARAP